jgi:hypothetical protein
LFSVVQQGDMLRHQAAALREMDNHRAWLDQWPAEDHAGCV